eukprot:TRINITY_DN40321_c0_g1_i1.p1 TRINITY_DN40321_c0_g1~~TRINITY_DN40321_c0_g1_i1.p1  ORF type:complete len:312 (+),score=50.17 TRINITY_DN40321_c0_g1_i1:162-1097(+)
MNSKKSRVSVRTRIAVVSALVIVLFVLRFPTEQLEEEVHLLCDECNERLYTPEHVQDYCIKATTDKVHGVTKIMMHLKKPITLLDVGANHGHITLQTLYCMNVSHSALAVEPIPESARRLTSYVRRFGTAVADKRVSFRQVALSDVNRKSSIFLPANRSDNAALSKSASVKNVGERDVQEIVVNLRKADDLIDVMVNELSEKRMPVFVKIDTQGNEPRVMAGMKRFLSAHRDDGLLVFAEHDKNLLRESGFEASAAYDLMKSLGYRAYCKPEVRVTDDGLGHFELSGEEWKREHMWTKTCTDILYWSGRKR